MVIRFPVVSQGKKLTGLNFSFFRIESSARKTGEAQWEGILNRFTTNISNIQSTTRFDMLIANYKISDRYLIDSKIFLPYWFFEFGSAFGGESIFVKEEFFPVASSVFWGFNLGLTLGLTIFPDSSLQLRIESSADFTPVWIISEGDTRTTRPETGEGTSVTIGAFHHLSHSRNSFSLVYKF